MQYFPRPSVYLGPSLSLTKAKEFLEATYLPPIKRGDLEKVEAGSVVLIVDGEFSQSLPVSPKEIIRAMDRGCKVIGASSMGALRAAELSVYGMIGIGWVFQSYKSGEITCDDEVAVMLSPFDSSASTVPLVNVRWWLKTLVDRGHLSSSDAGVGIQIARSIFFGDRTELALGRKLERWLGRERHTALLALDGGRIPDRKGEDAVAALEFVKNLFSKGD